MSTEKELAKKLKELRTEKGLTQTELAELSGIEYKHVQLLESQKNTHSPTLRTLEKLSQALEIELWQLIKEIS